ncbi:MAG: ECF transporter S component, partial [Oscillospiraceae bacterium]|nr:ECF transporter S component [Oscillospiraceae bacterium]
LAMIGVMAAIVFVGNQLQLPKIPTPLGPTRIHLGNVMCILGGLLFGAVPGGLAAGLGGAIYDLLDPFYAKEFWITFILKFGMGYVAGLIASGKKTKIKVVLAAVIGSLSYVALYLGKTFIVEYLVMGNPWQTVVGVLVTKGTASLINALLAMVVSVILYYMIEPALKQAGLLENHRR